MGHRSQNIWFVGLSTDIMSGYMTGGRTRKFSRGHRSGQTSPSVRITVPSNAQSRNDAALSASSSPAQPKSWSDAASPSSDSLSVISPRLRFVDAAGRTGEISSLISA